MQARDALQAIYHAAIKASQPSLLLRQHLKVSRDSLVVDLKGRLERIPLKGKVYIIGVGKGVDRTGAVLEHLFAERLAAGLLLSRDRFHKDSLKLTSIHVGSHPIPDERSLRGTLRCLELLRGIRREDLVLFILMGGASSLLVRPAAGLTLGDKRGVADYLLKSGMSIGEMNSVRKHLSDIKAGGLLRAAYPARVVSLVISDVVGDDPAVIGSAPTCADPTTFADAWNTLRKYRLLSRIPPRAREHLLRGLQGKIPETLKPADPLSRGNPYFLLANNRDALVAAKKRAEGLGFHTTVVTAELRGDTRIKARELATHLTRISRGKGSHRKPRCLLLGGETTVRVRGKGLGGRNLEFALTCAQGLAGSTNVFLLSADSDGSDGPTDAAGAFADGRSLSRARGLGLQPSRALQENDSYRFFQRLGDLFSPGSTGTNVLDLKIALIV
ncbi:MAG: DUF4147 domain-containing protein [Candidatus Binatia bacterium]|jgi:hydroxypyruvate reductase|nr:DUF4147 domain-containing protein [Candidatus Binatia bacterium]